ncbi:hypothetical protein GQ43DRAFT_453529 [Delitschia confertaspora ATCC 74209]|uniref:Guanine nucleotide-exchange factor SEC12 n=1 Tax=Delitschia confertaspora ATCC 74209 TaxID=1513339 RepID=A0A9P4JTD0_9PLEO|nr:hypothetical protein GQ43DRAFT_453529 [Delitschia confertaspora ATCC 74209]
MAPPISFSKATTSYPVYSATFAHNHPGLLVVGGGGGPGRSGVGNKITVFDVSSRAADLVSSAELELSRDEDSVTCLANLATKDGLILYAGINSSENDCLADKNQHFRSFEVIYSKKKKNPENDLAQMPKALVRYLSKSTLFKPFSSAVAKKEGYQGLVRLSPPRRNASGTKRIGAIVSRFARGENEIVVFNATTAEPKAPGDVIQRISPYKGEEANDIDIIEPEDAEFKLAYSTDFDVYVLDVNYDFGKKQLRGKEHVSEKKYTVPYPDGPETNKNRSKVRSIRWLSPSHILLLVNLPNKSGVELQVLRLYGDTMGSITHRKRLPGHVKAAVDMDICLLDADEKGAYQIAIAVAGNDVSTSIFTLDYHGTDSNTVSRFHSYTTFREVHPQGITKLVFSPFIPPSTGPLLDKVDKSGPQYIRLASTSYGNTVVVDTFTLKRVSSKPGSRWVLASAGNHGLQKWATYLVAAIVLLVALMLAQPLYDSEGTLTNRYVPAPIRNILGTPIAKQIATVEQALPPSVLPLQQPTVRRTPHRLRDLLHSHKHENTENVQQVVVIQHDPDTGALTTAVHPGGAEEIKEQTEAKKWDEMSHVEKNHWKEKLIKAGAWTVDEGETVLKSIFFGQVAGLVGNVAQGILNG